MDSSFLSLFDPYDAAEAEDEINNTLYDTNNNPKQNRDGKEIKLHTTMDRHQHNIVLDFENGSLPPEPQLGNIEYKLKLINPSQQRFEHLVTQMKWRLREGHGEAIYEIGVSDSGQLRGLVDRDMTASLETLRRMAQKLGASTMILRRKTVASRRSVVEVLVRKIPDDQHNIEVRVGVLGKSQAGKSTLLGVLTQGEFIRLKISLVSYFNVFVFFAFLR